MTVTSSHANFSSDGLKGAPTNSVEMADMILSNNSTMRTSSIAITTPVLMFTTGVVGNLLALVVLVMSRRRQRKNSAFYQMVACLAITDLFGTLNTSPVVIAAYKNGGRFPGGVALCSYFGFIMTWAGVASTLMAGVMAVERFLAVKFPIWHNVRFTQMCTRGSILSIWCLSAVISAMPLVGLGSYGKQIPGTWCFFQFSSKEKLDVTFSCVYSVFIILIILVTVVCNLAVVVILLRLRPRSSSGTSPTSHRSRHSSVRMETGVTHVTPSIRSRHIQMVVLLMGIVLISVVCWLPLMVWILLSQMGFHTTESKIDLMVVRLAAWNPILNPWVYILCRKEVFDLLRRCTIQRVNRKSDAIKMERRVSKAMANDVNSALGGCLCGCDDERALRRARVGSRDSIASQTGSSFISRASTAVTTESFVSRRSSGETSVEIAITRSRSGRYSTTATKEEQVRLSILHEASEPDSKELCSDSTR